MIINIPISIGELVDKITILQIKSLEITDTAKLNNITRELKLLDDVLDSTGLKSQLVNLHVELYNINYAIWRIEDSIRECEKNSQFDETFVDLTRTVHKTNIRRGNVKRNINLQFGSDIVEEKSYEDQQ